MEPESLNEQMYNSEPKDLNRGGGEGAGSSSSSSSTTNQNTFDSIGNNSNNNNSADVDDDSSTSSLANRNSTFDGAGFADYLAPYALALVASTLVTLAFFKFVLLDY
jgi:hypothetical protein